METLQDFLKEERFLLVVLRGCHRSINPAVQYNLNLTIRVWLEQNRIHVRFRFNARGFGLGDLSASYFTAVPADE